MHIVLRKKNLTSSHQQSTVVADVEQTWADLQERRRRRLAHIEPLQKETPPCNSIAIADNPNIHAHGTLSNEQTRCVSATFFYPRPRAERKGKKVYYVLRTVYMLRARKHLTMLFWRGLTRALCAGSRFSESYRVSKT